MERPCVLCGHRAPCSHPPRTVLVPLARAPRVAVVGVRRARTGVGPFIARHLVRAGAVVPAFIGTRAETVEIGASLLESIGIRARGFTDLDTLLAAEPVDALAIASPHETHAHWLERALAAGLHVLCEKPLLYPTLEASRRVRDLVNGFGARKLLLQENCHWPYTLSAFDRLHPGGAVRASSFEMWLAPASTGPDMLIDALSHPLSMLQSIVDPEVRAALPLSNLEVACARDEAVVTFNLRCGAGGLSARLALQSRGAHPPTVGYSIDGLRAERRAASEDGFSLFDGGREIPFSDPMAALIRDFVLSLGDGSPRGHFATTGACVAARADALHKILTAVGPEAA